MMKPTTGPAGPDIPAGAMEAPLRAIAEVLDGAGDLSQSFLATAQRHNDLANERDKMQVSSMIRDRQAAITEELMRQPNPGQWVSTYETGMDSLQSEIEQIDLSPMVRDQMQMRFQEVRGAGKVQVSRDALQENLAQTRATWKHTFSQAQERGDWAEAEQALAEGQGIFDDGYLGRMGDSLEHSRQVWEVRQDIDLDPSATIERLQGEEYAALPLADRERLEREAVREQTIREKSAVEKIQQMTENGQLPTRDDLEKAMKAEKDFPEELIPEVLRNYDDSEPLDFSTKYGITDGLNGLHGMLKRGEITMDQYRISHAQYGKTVFAMGNRQGSGQLRSRWYALDPSTWSDGRTFGEGTDKKADLTRDMEREVSKYESHGLFGKVDSFAPAHVRKEQRDAIARKRVLAEQDMEDWLTKNPEAGKLDMLKYFSETASMKGSTTSMLRRAAARRRERVEELDTVAPPGSWPPASGVLPGKGEIEKAREGLMSPLSSPASGASRSGALLDKATQGGAGAGKPISGLPPERGRVVGDKAVGLASTYWDEPSDDNGMTSVGISRANAPWWKTKKLPTIALAPETAKAMGLSLPKKRSRAWDISNSMVEVTLPDGRTAKAVYAENGMYINPNSKNKLIDLSEQFQQLHNVPRGATLSNVKVRPL